jgi:hypothetical protein
MVSLFLYFEIYSILYKNFFLAERNNFRLINSSQFHRTYKIFKINLKIKIILIKINLKNFKTFIFL